MGRHYRHMTRDDRLQMEVLLKTGMGFREIGANLGFSYWTIRREYGRGLYIHRNPDWTEEARYSCDLGQRIHDENVSHRGRPEKIGNDNAYAAAIEDLIADEKYSPEAALAQIKKSGKEYRTTISTPTLYRYIRSGLFLRLSISNLPIVSRRKKTRGKVHRIPRKRPAAGKSIEVRPKEIRKRETFGNWEMDTVVGPQGGSSKCLLVLSERQTRREIIRLMQDHTSASVVRELDRLEKEWGRKFRRVFQTITVDNGSEFSDPERMERSFLWKGRRTEIFYCHPRCAFERGTNENINRMVRRFYPKGTDFASVTKRKVAELEEWINHYPRRMFQFLSSDELFQKQLLSLT